MKSRASSSFAFKSGAVAGIVSLLFSFIIRLGGLAPFAPESAIEKFISIIPASLEQPMIQALGDTAGLLGLIVASILAIILFGVFGLLFEKVYSPWISKYQRGLTRTEEFLIYSIVPWLFFGLVVFPLSGANLFGISAPVLYANYVVILAPVSLLFSEFVFSLVLAAAYKAAGIFETTAAAVSQNKIQEGILSPTRRVFIERSAVIIGVAILGLTSIGSIIASAASSLSTTGSRAGSSYDLSAAPPIFSDKRLASLVDSEITSNANFYRVAIDVIDPSVNVNTWNLKVSGSNNTKTYTLEDIKSLPTANFSEYSTFECVSNLVNGNLISNAQWTGIKISDLLSDAGLDLSNVQYVVFDSIDGYNVGIPLSRALMPDSILAYGMNGVDLPKKNGYPLRAVIPGLYGMMSAKWVTEIILIDSFYNGFWQSRGYTSNATVNTLAFIIIPSDGSQVSLSQNNGSVLLGGYAFAGDRGISMVELSFDEGQTWQTATLKPPISDLAWNLWAFNWFPSKTGSYNVYARATDGTGQVQTAAQASPFPNGATGYAMITLNVTS